jgi:hypothetical protein
MTDQHSMPQPIYDKDEDPALDQPPLWLLAQGMLAAVVVWAVRHLWRRSAACRAA